MVAGLVYLWYYPLLIVQLFLFRHRFREVLITNRYREVLFLRTPRGFLKYDTFTAPYYRIHPPPLLSGRVRRQYRYTLLRCDPYLAQALELAEDQSYGLHLLIVVVRP